MDRKMDHKMDHKNESLFKRSSIDVESVNGRGIAVGRDY